MYGSEYFILYAETGKMEMRFLFVLGNDNAVFLACSIVIILLFFQSNG